MESPNIQDGEPTNAEIKVSWKPTSPSKSDNKNSTEQDRPSTCDRQGRRHSSSLSAIVGNISSRLKRSSSTVGSSSAVCIPESKVPPTGSMSTPSKRKNPSSTSATIQPENMATRGHSRRSSTPTNQKCDDSAFNQKGRKASLTGFFSGTRKFSLQLYQNGGDQLPPRPPLMIRESNMDNQTIISNTTNKSSQNAEGLGQIGVFDGIRNGIPSDVALNNNITPSCSSTSRVFGGTFNNKALSDRRHRIHKHSLQQGNKWKLLQQKVLGNLDEEKDDDQELCNGQSDGKVLFKFLLLNDNDKMNIATSLRIQIYELLGIY